MDFGGNERMFDYLVPSKPDREAKCGCNAFESLGRNSGLIQHEKS